MAYGPRFFLASHAGEVEPNKLSAGLPYLVFHLSKNWRKLCLINLRRPWTMNQSDVGLIGVYKELSAGCVKDICDVAATNEQRIADARLIAAAPALHAALANAIRELKWAADNSKNYEEPVSLAVIQGCEAALALVENER